MGEIKGKNAKKFAKRAKQKDFTDMLDTYIVPLLKLKKTQNVADFGTGSGNIIPFLINNVKELTAVEPSIDMVNIMQKNYGHYKNLKIINKEANKTGLPENSYDIVITKFALHHIKDAEAVFNEAKRILKPDGKLIIIDMVFSSTAFIKIIEPLYKLIKALRQGMHEFHCVYRNKQVIINTAKSAGFKMNKKQLLPGKNTYRDRHYPAYIFIFQQSV
ncbi:MAG: class I SAM-dependent methyltransferase [Candidatus Nanoarchaeia archaeon]